jgi:hypothetical protein
VHNDSQRRSSADSSRGQSRRAQLAGTEAEVVTRSTAASARVWARTAHELFVLLCVVYSIVSH